MMSRLYLSLRQGQAGGGARWNPAQRISSWWDERVRGQVRRNASNKLRLPWMDKCFLQCGD